MAAAVAVAPGVSAVADEGKPGAKPAKVKAPKAPRSRSWLSDVLLSFFLVAMGTLAAGSTYLALQAVKQRDSAQGDLDNATVALDQVLLSAANASRLKGPLPAASEARKQIFTPASTYYQQFVSKHKDDKELLPQVAKNYFYLAGIQAKMGDAACVSNLGGGIAAIDLMGTREFAPDQFPSVQSALKLSTPNDWATVKVSRIEMHIFSLVVTINRAVEAYTKLVAKFPNEPLFYDDLSSIHRVAATLQSQVDERKPFAIEAWTAAAGLLEKLNQLRPGNVDYQNRLLEALVGAGRLQLEAGKNDAAIVNMQRAVEVREQMAAATPDDKTLAEELEKAKKELAAIKPGSAEPVAEEAAEEPVAEEPAAEAPAEEPAAE